MICVRCNDSGWIEYTAGAHYTHRGKKIVATAEKPVFKKCSCKKTRAEAHVEAERTGE